jgi:hypothetical protein
MRTAELATIERYIAEPRSGPERRAHPRETLFVTALLVLPDGFQLIDLLSGLGYEGLTVWRAPPEAGARRLATYDLRAAQDGIGEKLQAAWKAALA